MRRIVSALVLAVLAAIVLAASVDTVRKALETSPEPAQASLRPIDALSLVAGRLKWIDARCRLHVTALSTLQEPKQARRVPCGARLAPSGRLASPASRRPERREAGRPVVAGLEGGSVAAATDSGIVVVRPHGPPVELPIAGARALAWSPDERWLAAAAEETVYLIRMFTRDRRIRSLPIVATDLAWVS